MVGAPDFNSDHFKNYTKNVDELSREFGMALWKTLEKLDMPVHEAIGVSMPSIGIAYSAFTHMAIDHLAEGLPPKEAKRLVNIMVDAQIESMTTFLKDLKKKKK